MSLLQQLRDANALRTLDHALAQSLRRLDPDTPDVVLAAAALASLAVASGHAGFSPSAPQLLVDAPIDWPAPADWQAQLDASRWVARPVDADSESAADAPLVSEHGLLYLRRYREYERHLVLGLRRIGAHVPDASDVAALAPLFAQLFPGASASVSGDAPDLQARAAASALRHSLLLVTGGPGTGKTTTITRLLVLLTAQAAAAGKPAPRIALAAPTGRAAERIAESLRNAVQALTALGIAPALCEHLPTTGTTLHRLLGTIPDSPRFRHHADNSLPVDVVVVDEASMIDLPLMAKLVDAVADGARLVLLGDPDQLPSVEAGDVLSGILRAAGDGSTLTDDDARALQPLLGNTSGDATDLGGSRFPGRHVHLRRGYRQSEALQLAPLASAVRAGDSQAALALLRRGELSGVQFHEGLADPLQTHRQPLLAHWTALADSERPADALALAGRLRILTAVREGPQGARGLNARIEALLTERLQSAGALQAGSTGQGYFHGRLLLITENSYRHRLFNGDIGICLRSAASPSSGRSEASPLLGANADDDGALMAWFPGDDPQHPRPFHPAALPAHESAFAMTVHKAQGSEFDDVWLLLPARFNRVLSRELVYTGMTRARQTLHLAASADVITDALARHASRWSGLGWRLGEQDTPAPRQSAPVPEPDTDGPPSQGALF
ncbi:exodeoxyribonuclease V subunit alpha [Luteimonas sp. RIT-PG2_3]